MNSLNSGAFIINYEDIPLQYIGALKRKLSNDELKFLHSCAGHRLTEGSRNPARGTTTQEYLYYRGNLSVEVHVVKVVA